jgi:hypothetical protein
MQITRKIATGAAAASLGLASFAGIGLATASHAGAAPARHHHVHCGRKHGHNYPPGKCFITFDKSKYHRGDTVHFHAKRFTAGATVKESLSCKSFHKRVGTDTAGHHGGVFGKFTLPDKTPKGHCTLRVHGGGSSVEGSFKARH